MSSGWGDFLGGLANGLPQGVSMYGDLRRLALQEQQAQLQQQMEQRRNQLMDQQAQAAKVSAITQIAKIKDPKARQAFMQFQLPNLGIDPKDPQAQALIEGLASGDPQFEQNYKAFATQLGISPEGASVLGSADQNPEAVGNLLRLYTAQQSSGTADERMALARERLGLAQQQFDLSGQRFQQQQNMQGLRAQGLIPPMGYTPQAGGGLAPIPGGPATVPTESENKAADFMVRAQQSQEAGMAFMQKYPEYLGSLRAQLDQAMGDTGYGGPIAAAGGAVGGVLGGIAARNPWGIGIGAAAGTTVGKNISESASRMLTSDQGLEFQAAWAPFVNATLRRDTGATVNPQEWSYAIKQFIPTPSDPPDAVALKAQNRAAALQGMGISANRALSKTGVSAPLKTLDPQVEQTAEQLARKVQAGQATPQERAQLGAILRAKGYNFQ